MRTTIQELGNAFVEMKTIDDISKKLQEINEHIKKEQKQSQIPIPYWSARCS
ncbi:MAG: hypothetical protein WBZ36_08645 [Candidatus Nitrosopolaris sp.]